MFKWNSAKAIYCNWENAIYVHENELARERERESCAIIIYSLVSLLPLLQEMFNTTEKNAIH